MYKHYRRSRKPAVSQGVLLVLLLIVLAALASPLSFLQKSYLLIPVVLTLGIIAIAGAVIFLYQLETARRAKLRALQLSDIDNMGGVEFEGYIGTLLKSQGYSVSYTSTTGDYGVDLLAKRDQITFAVQAKRYAGSVGDHAIMEAVAGMQHYKANRAIVITSNYFTPHARTLAASTNCILIDRDKLADWILAFQDPQHPAFSLD